MAQRRARFRIGTSGWQYAHWRGVLYPEGLPARAWLEHYAQTFDSVEVNNTFYRLPEANVFEAWRERAPRGFLFALKLSRYATHLKRLLDPAEPLALFVERARRLGPTLGPILVQLPPRFAPDPLRLDAFLRSAPKDLRWVVEFRDERWLTRDVLDVLEKHGAALCIHDLIEDHPRVLTADFTYLRFHGTRYAGSYSSQKLSHEADAIAKLLAEHRDVYAYFNNDLGGHAVHDARALRRYVETRLGSSARISEWRAGSSP